MADQGRFSRIEAAIAALPEERARGDAFEHVVTNYLRHDPERGLRQVWSWADWPGRIANRLPGTDLGIDLVAEDETGALVGIQVKHRLDPRQAIRWGEVATALAYRPDLFARRLIVTNAYDRTANTGRATETTSKVGWVLRADLLASPVDWSGALPAASGAAAPMRFGPRPYQRVAVDDVVATLIDNERAQLVMACGTGKTLVTLWVAEARHDERVLVLVPTLLLLKQFRREWRTHAQLPFVDLAVCSDADTVGRDEWRVRSDALGVQVTTDPSDIAGFLRRPGRRVVFGTYASSARIAEAQADGSVPAFDLVVADEAHRVAGIVPTWEAAERDQRVVLDASRLRSTRRLFATATPRIYGAATRRRVDEMEDVEVASMDDGALFGPVAHRLSFREAVDLKILVDYELVVVLVTDAEVAELVRDRAGLVVDGRVLDAETLATLVAIRRAITDLSLTRSITFHHTIARARDFATALERLELASAAPKAEHVSGQMPVGDRERVLQALVAPARPTVVTNARCLTEGIDVPGLDAVAFVDPRGSQVDIVQAVGRVMRRAKGKTRGHVLVPVFLDRAALADPEAAVAGSSFANVLDVLRALRAHDPELASDASRIKASLGPRAAIAGGHIAEHVRLLGTEAELARFERALELRFVEIAVDQFEFAIGSLRQFAARERNALVPARHVEGGVRLGHWVNNWRVRHRRGELSSDRVAALQAIPGWSWDPVEDDWQTAIAALRRFAAREGHALVPQHHVEGGVRLGRWATRPRTSHRRGVLGAERVAALEAIPGWSWDPKEEEWQTAIAALRRFAAREGHVRVPEGHHEDGVWLRGWVTRSRKKYRRENLSVERVAALEAIPGWSWDPAADGRETAVAALRHFATREGHARVPRNHVEGGVRLGRWAINLRTKYRRGSLDAKTVTELEAIPGWSWDPVADAWETAVAALRHFATREGHARVPDGHLEDGLPLAYWVSNRRAEYRRGELSAGRIAELQAISGWSWGHSSAGRTRKK